MPRLSMNELTTYRWTFEEDVIRYLDAGISAIGVWRQKLSDYGEEKGRELLLETGLQVSNLLWAGGFTGSDGRTFRESVVDAEEAIHLAADLNAGCLVVYSGARGGHTHRHARRLIAEALRELVPLAATLDVTLALEPMHAGCACGWTFLTDLEDTLGLIDDLANPHVGLAFDTYHLGQQPGILESIPQIADRIAIVHLGDSRTAPRDEQNRCPLGEGVLPLSEIVAALAAAGYNGDYDIELLGEEIELASYHDLIRHSKQAYRELICR